MLVVRDFNDRINAKNIQEFNVEMGLHVVFSEAHQVEERNRDDSIEYGTKCADYVWDMKEY